MIRVFVPVVVLTAAVQALLVWPAITPLSGPFLLVAAASFLVTVAALWLAASAAGHERPGWRGLLWSAITVVAAILAAVVSIFAVPIVLTAALFVLPSAVDPTARVLDGFRAVRREPIRLVVSALLTILVLFVVWVLALLFGLFVTGPLGAAATWLVFGLVGVLLVWWTGLVRRAS